MKARKNLKILSWGIRAIVGLHLVFFLIAVKTIRSTWIQSNKSSNELTGAIKMYYGTGFGYIDKGFEFVYDHLQYEKGQHLYRTGNGYLLRTDSGNGLPSLLAKNENNQAEALFTTFPLVVPVSLSQKNQLIYYNSAYLLFLVIYSLLIFIQLGRYIASLISGDSIINSNLRLLRIIGILVLAQPIIVYAMQYFEMSWIRNNFSFEGYSIVSNFPFQLQTFGLGVLILAITETVHQSIQLKKEQELTI